ncbi:MAG: AAA family ATPase, partial [Pseudomonadota bacterium]
MRLQALRLQNVRRFVEPVAVTGIAPGLNVLAAANEQGKSTLLDALHALFFTRHRAWDQHVRALQPHAGGDPQVQAEIALDGACWTVAKTWRKSRNGSATVHRDGILRHQADEAEAWIAERVRPPKDGGPAGLVWVRQGVLGLGEGRPDMLARRSVMASVAGEVAAMTGGRRMDRTVDAVGAALARYLTDTGRVKTGGPLAEAEKAVEERCATREALSRQAAALRDELEARARLRRERARLD